jgi:hypothetical protein
MRRLDLCKEGEMRMPMRAWADIGSHGGIFVFDSGLVYDRAGPLLNIWETKFRDDLVEVEIRIKEKKHDPRRDKPGHRQVADRAR